MRSRPFAVILTLAAILASPGSTATAQQGPPQTNTIEFGIDAGATFGLGDISSVQVTLPASRFRVGFLMPGNSRWSIEPAAFISMTKVEDIDLITTYNLEIGALYHFQPALRVLGSPPPRQSVLYVRPFVGVAGITGGGSDDVDDDSGSDSEFSVGTGLGMKIPWRQDLAWRLEANVGYGFDNEAFRLGLLAGLSFFTR